MILVLSHKFRAERVQGSGISKRASERENPFECALTSRTCLPKRHTLLRVYTRGPVLCLKYQGLSYSGSLIQVYSWKPGLNLRSPD